MAKKNLERPSFAPRNWGGWFTVGLIWVLGQMPQGVGRALSRPLGWLVMRLMKGRQRVAERNIECCFPDLSEKEQEQLVKNHFRSLARMLFETAWSWAAPEKRVDRWGEVINPQYANDLQRQGRGVLMLTAHSTCIEIGGYFTGRATNKPWIVYRPLKSPVLEWYSNWRRGRYTSGGIGKRVFRTMVAHLKDGGMLWYAPDQDFGRERSVFAPFFGIDAATLAATVQLVEMTGCAVVPMFCAFDEKTGKYLSVLQPPLDHFPSGDIVADLARVNALIEQHVRQYPDQYWWIHRRFKTRPDGEPPFYD